MLGASHQAAQAALSATSQGYTAMGKKTDRRFADNLRTMLAQEAARLIRDHGIDDYRNAKLKAAENLGLGNRGALPTNREIEAALAERNRIFGAERHQDLLTQLRRVAVEVMQDLQIFAPRLVGGCAEWQRYGTLADTGYTCLATRRRTWVCSWLRSGCSTVRCNKRLRLQRDTFERFHGYRFYADDFKVETTVFPERREKHAPLSPLDGRPMRRAKLKDVELLAGAA